MAVLTRFKQSSRSTRGLFAIMAGTAAGQVLALIASPLLSRFYTPADFGLFSVISSIAITISTIFTLRFDLAIPLPERDSDGRAIVMIGAITCCISLIVFTALAWFLGPWTADLLKNERLRTWLIAAPLIAASLAIFRLLNQWALRLHRYSATAQRNVLQAVSTVVIQAVGGWRGVGATGLIGGYGGGQLIGAASLLRSSGLTEGHVTRDDMRCNFRRYKQFAVYLAPAGLLNTLGVFLPLLMVAAFYGTTVAGWLGFTQRVLATPMTLIGQSAGQVYVSELAGVRRERTGREIELFWQATKRLSALGGLALVGLLLLAPFAFGTVFGARWHESGQMAQALSISIATQLVASPLSQTLVIYERTLAQFAWDFGRLGAVIATVAIPASLGASPLTTVWCMSIATGGAYVVSWELSRRAVHSPDSRHHEPPAGPGITVATPVGAAADPGVTAGSDTGAVAGVVTADSARRAERRDRARHRARGMDRFR